MFKRLLLILCITLSSLTFAGDYVGARIISSKATNFRISDFRIDKDLGTPIVVVNYRLKKNRKIIRKTISYQVEGDFLSDLQFELISKEGSFFSTRSEQRKLAESLFDLETADGLSGLVLLL
ncbi:MAG: hypothetical protein KAG61_04120, partial [Bacteriovoracaceae bacterium]|nr:hypothetical protein [Bacteriovoracaceae bacterium]